MPGLLHRNLGSVIADLVTGGQTTAPGQAGQKVLDILSTVGGLTNAGAALYPNVAVSATWIAVGTGTQAFAPTLTALVAESARVPVITTTLTGAAAMTTGFLGGGVGNGWLTELGVFQGGTIASGSGTLLAYVIITPGPFCKHALKECAVQYSVQ